MTWAERIKTLRERLGLTISGFANLLGVSYHAIWGWERNKIPDTQCAPLLINMLEQNLEEGVRLLSQRFMGFGEETFGERVRRVRESMGLTLKDFAALLKVSQGSVVKWETGVNLAEDCIGVLVDLLEHHLEEAAPLLWPNLGWKSIEEGATAVPELVSERIWLLLEATGLSPADLGRLIRANPLTVEHWLHDRSKPDTCFALLIWLLETHGPKAYFLMKDVPDEAWPSERILALRKSLGFTIEEMGELLGITLGGYSALERQIGKNRRDSCWRLIFTLLDSKQDEMLDLLRGLPRPA